MERRQHSDRLTRVEVAVERVESDVKGLMAIYKEVATQQQSMFVESIKSSSHLQSAIETLTRTVTEFTKKLITVESKVEDHEKWKWKTTGVITGVVIVVNIVGWFVSRVV